MPTAGDIITVPTVPGSRIATQIETSDSASFTSTRVEVSSVIAALVVGRIYRVRAHTRFKSSNAGDNVLSQIRENDSNGAVLTADERKVSDTQNGTTIGTVFNFEAEYTASSTGEKTFSLTGARTSGSGNCSMEADAVRPTYFYVDYIRDA